MLVGRPAGYGLAMGLEGGQQDCPRLGGEAAGEPERAFEIDPVAQVAPAMGPAVTLVVVGGGRPHPGRRPLQLGPRRRLGQLQQVRLRVPVGDRGRGHLDHLALGQRARTEAFLGRRQPPHGLGRLQQVDCLAHRHTGGLSEQMRRRAVTAREPGAGLRHPPGAQDLARRRQPLHAGEGTEQLE